jgi:predicted transcriptional regulator
MMDTACARRTADVESALDVLSDDYACRILATLEEGPMGAADLAEACNMSRATAYRRLERLEDVGFVTAEMTYDADGHHRKQFHLALDELQLEVGPHGVDGSVSLAHPAD